MENTLRPIKSRNKLSAFTYLSIVIVGIFLIFLFSLWNILFPFVLGVILAFLLDPFVVWLERLKVPRPLGILIIMLILIGLSIFILGFLLPAAISGTATSLTAIFQRLQTNQELMQQITLYFSKYNIHMTSKDITDFLFSKLSPILGNAVNFSFIVVKFILQSVKVWVLCFLTLIYILMGKQAILRSMMEIIPYKQKKIVISLYRSIIEQIYQFIISLMIVSVMVFIFTWIFLQFFQDSPSAFGLALGSGILSMIPFLGGILPPIFVFIVQVIYSTSINTILWVFIGELIFYLFIGLYLQPMMTGKKVKIHPLIILICIIIGGSLDGVFGVLLSVPTYIIIRTLFAYFFDKYKKEEVLLSE